MAKMSEKKQSELRAKFRERLYEFNKGILLFGDYATSFDKPLMDAAKRQDDATVDEILKLKCEALDWIDVLNSLYREMLMEYNASYIMPQFAKFADLLSDINKIVAQVKSVKTLGSKVGSIHDSFRDTMDKIREAISSFTPKKSAPLDRLKPDVKSKHYDPERAKLQETLAREMAGQTIAPAPEASEATGEFDAEGLIDTIRKTSEE